VGGWRTGFDSLDTTGRRGGRGDFSDDLDRWVGWVDIRSGCSRHDRRVEAPSRDLR